LLNFLNAWAIALADTDNEDNNLGFGIIRLGTKLGYLFREVMDSALTFPEFQVKAHEFLKQRGHPSYVTQKRDADLQFGPVTL